MLIVISDTSPITNLIQIGHLSVLKSVFGQIIIPQSVYEELIELPSQKILLLGNTDWISVEEAQDKALLSVLEKDLDKGEAEAIALSIEKNADLIIIDEAKGREIATDKGLKIVGLLGTLIKAKEQGYIISMKPLLESLIHLGFRVKPSLYQHILHLVGE